jgi:DNA (cytosine-5)-methyltransferase 1
LENKNRRSELSAAGQTFSPPITRPALEFSHSLSNCSAATFKLLDLFCCQGGAGEGYKRAGFDVTGVDIEPQPKNPHRFILDDALKYVKAHGHEYDAIHASPPCQHHSWVTPTKDKGNHPDLIAATRTALRATGKPYVIENVGGARKALVNPIKLCGSMFGLRSYRHRYFEVWPYFLLAPSCNHTQKPLLVTTCGANSIARMRAETGANKSVKNAPLAYGIQWMTCEGLKQAIPPSYTEWIGRQIITELRRMQPNVQSSGTRDRTT